MIPVRFSRSSLKGISWRDYLVRFVLGGLATVATGVISRVFGPSIGGLFLALPAIFCASATLIEKHERTRKKRSGFAGARRGQQAAALDAAGAALGSLGMLAFAASFLWLVEMSAVAAFAGATLIWLLVSASCWWVRRYVRVTDAAKRDRRSEDPGAMRRGNAR